MRILITGSTGLIGTELVALLLRKGESVHYLTTSKEKLGNRLNYQGFYWNPEKGIIDESALIGVDAIIHLAGATVSRRWTDAYKQEIVESRVFSANLLYKTLKSNPHQVKQIVSASAVGIYPGNLTKLYYEDETGVDDSFLGKVVTKWEESADRFRSLGIKVCKLRTGLVLSEKGGALPEMAKPIRLGFGSAFGSGKQYQSWIHIDDLASLYYFAVTNSLQGVYNAVAPTPITNAMLTKEIAKALGKPLFMPNIPKFLLKLILGEMHEILFTSQKVSARKAIESGFQFRFTEADKAIKDLFQIKKP